MKKLCILILSVILSSCGFTIPEYKVYYYDKYPPIYVHPPVYRQYNYYKPPMHRWQPVLPPIQRPYNRPTLPRR